MDQTEQRHILRDSLFVMASLRLHGIAREVRVKVRNLSAGGLMAEGQVRVTPGAQLAIEIRNIGWVNGVVAWVQENRFGIAFAQEIDPKLARGQAPVGMLVEASDFQLRRPLAASAQAARRQEERLRKV